MHCHHEKLVIVDDEVAFVGGIDLTALAGDRYDSNAHPHKEDAIGWHDASSLLRGPIVRDVAAHFALRWEAVTGEALDAARSRPRRPATRPSSSSAPCPRAPTTCSRAASSRSSRPTSARCAARST